MKMKNVESMFAGRFTVVARMEHEIVDRSTGEASNTGNSVFQTAARYFLLHAERTVR